MYVCAYVCMYVRMYVCIYVRMYVFIYVRMYVSIYIYIYIYMNYILYNTGHDKLALIFLFLNFFNVCHPELFNTYINIQ